jgi:hypothetical protein
MPAATSDSRIAEHDRFARRRRRRDAIGVEVERDVRETLVLQHAREVLPRTAVAANDDVGTLPQALRRNARHLQRLLHPFRRRQPQYDAVGVLDQERSGEHREQHRGENRLQQVRIDEMLVENQVQEHEAELARLREAESRAHGDAGRGAE